MNPNWCQLVLIPMSLILWTVLDLFRHHDREIEYQAVRLRGIDDLILEYNDMKKYIFVQMMVDCNGSGSHKVEFWQILSHKAHALANFSKYLKNCFQLRNLKVSFYLEK
jgi:hypothetical protein